MTRPIPFHACKGKVRYHNANQAKMALRAVRGNIEKRAKTPVRYYECPLCNGWHITARPFAPSD